MNMDDSMWSRSYRQALVVVWGLYCKVEIRLAIVENLYLVFRESSVAPMKSICWTSVNVIFF